MKMLFLPLLLVAASFAQTDGPATLPTRTYTTPIISPNPPKTVSATDDLQAAILAAVPGDTLLVDPANVHAGPILLNVGQCDTNNGLTIKNAVAVVVDAKGRPVPGQPMPKIVLKGSQQIAGGSCVEWYGFEITRSAGTGTLYNLIMPGPGAHDLVFDHVYVHGTPTDETVRGLYLGGGVKNVRVEASYFSDFHCKALGTCGDSQAISGGIGDLQDSGNYLFENSYFEAATENVMFGGGGGSACPTDITVQFNDIAKPDSWNPLDPSYGGTKWIVKNLFELKNGCRVLVQGNTLHGSWAGYSQLGYAILAGAKNQGGACPACSVTDVTIRDNWIDHVGAAMQLMVAPMPGTTDVFGKETGRLSIHDNAFTNVGFANCYGGCGKWFMQISSAPGAPTPLHDVWVMNNTFDVAGSGWLNPGGIINIGGPVVAPLISGIRVEGNVFPGGQYPLYSTGGGAANCFPSGTLNYAASLAVCSGFSFTNNVVLLNGNTSKITWPAGNLVVPAGANLFNLKAALAGAVK